MCLRGERENFRREEGEMWDPCGINMRWKEQRTISVLPSVSAQPASRWRHTHVVKSDNTCSLCLQLAGRCRTAVQTFLEWQHNFGLSFENCQFWWRTCGLVEQCTCAIYFDPVTFTVGHKNQFSLWSVMFIRIFMHQSSFLHMLCFLFTSDTGSVSLGNWLQNKSIVGKKPGAWNSEHFCSYHPIPWMLHQAKAQLLYKDCLFLRLIQGLSRSIFLVLHNVMFFNVGGDTKLSIPISW